MDRLRIERIKRDAGFPKSSKFKGFVIHLPHTDEFLMHLDSNNLTDDYLWAIHPSFAKVFKKPAKAQRIVAGYGKPANVCHLFEDDNRYYLTAMKEI